MAQGDTYTIHLDGSWSLEDLYRFPRTYEQVYFFVNAVEIDDEQYVGEEVDNIFRSFPWRGGYSAVGFYNNLKFRTFPSRRPKIVSIRYASLGWIELGLLLVVAKQVEYIVKSVTNSIDRAHSTYRAIRKGISDHKLADIEVKRAQLALDSEQLDFIQRSCKSMAEILGLENIQQLDARTGNKLASLKILLSFYRRIKILADYELKGKADLSNSRHVSNSDDLFS